MKTCIFSSWNIRCGIRDHAAHIKDGFESLQPPVEVEIVPFDRRPHPREDYVRWGKLMNNGDVAHVQFDYAFFRYLLPWQNTFPSFAAQIRKPLVITRHVDFDGKLNPSYGGPKAWLHRAKWAAYQTRANPYATYLNKNLFDAADHVIVLSTHVKEHLVARGFPADKVTVLPPGVPPVKPTTPDAVRAVKARWAQEGWGDKIVLGNFGYIGPTKGLTTIAKALALLPDNYVLLIGGGLRREEDRPAQDEFEREVARLGLQSRVKITGYLDDDALATMGSAVDCHVYAHTRAEFSYTLTTAMALRAAPVVASDIPAHAELARMGAGIRLFRSRDPADLARIVQEVVARPDATRDMLVKFDAYIAAHTWTQIAARTRDIYAGVIAARQKRDRAAA